MIFEFKRVDNVFDIYISDNKNYKAILYLQNDCSFTDATVVETKEITSQNSSVTITLPNKDGIYKLLIFSGSSSIFLEKIVYHYPNLFNCLIDSIKESLCDCKCDDCEDCDKTNYSDILTKLLSYGIINNNKYVDNLTSTTKCVRCDISDIATCNVLIEQVTGKSDSNKLNKKLIAYYYLVYYYTDLKSKSSINNVDYEKLYDFKNISKCIAKLDVNNSCIKETIYSDINPRIFTAEFNPIFN